MQLYGKDLLKARLDSTAGANHLSHAILLHGEKGCGKRAVAKYISQLFMCGAPPCGKCVTCRCIEADGHPDIIYVLDKCGGKYNMEQLHDVIADTVIKPNKSNVKVYIFEDFDSMKPLLQNTLLKLIEEPLPFLRFIFTCENVNGILETILSRVTEYAVPQMSVADCTQALTDMLSEPDCELKCDPKRAAELAEMFSGNLGKCKSVLEGGEETKLIETACRVAAGIAARDKYTAAAALAEQSGREEFAEMLDYLSEILRDALAIRCGQNACSCGKKEAAGIAKAFDENGIINMLETVFEVSENGQLNLNMALTASYLASKLF